MSAVAAAVVTGGVGLYSAYQGNKASGRMADAANAASAQQYEIASRQQDMAEEQWSRYLDLYGGLEQDLINEVMGYEQPRPAVAPRASGREVAGAIASSAPQLLALAGPSDGRRGNSGGRQGRGEDAIKGPSPTAVEPRTAQVSNDGTIGALPISEWAPQTGGKDGRRERGTVASIGRVGGLPARPGQAGIARGVAGNRKDYGLDARVIASVDRAAGDVVSAFGRARENQRREMGRYGVDPTSGRFAGLSRGLDLAEAAGVAGARTRTRQDSSRFLEAQDWDKKVQTLSMGKGLPVNAGAMMSNAAQTVNNAGNTALTGARIQADAAAGNAQFMGQLAGMGLNYAGNRGWFTPSPTNVAYLSGGGGGGLNLGYGSGGLDLGLK